MEYVLILRKVVHAVKATGTLRLLIEIFRKYFMEVLSLLPSVATTN